MARTRCGEQPASIDVLRWPCRTIILFRGGTGGCPWRGKVCPGWSQHYAERSPAGPRWSQPQATLAERQPDGMVFEAGVVTLRRGNLVEADYDDQPTATDRQRRPRSTLGF